MTIDEVLAIARAGAAAGCREALFTLGDKPELRYRAARDELAALDCATTLEYLARAAEAVLDETGLLPHLNPGVLEHEDLRELRRVSASMGLMLETTSDRLSERGGPHHGSPDKKPAARLETIGLPVLTAEATELHIHMHIDVFVHGKPVTVPANVGINTAQRNHEAPFGGFKMSGVGRDGGTFGLYAYSELQSIVWPS